MATWPGAIKTYTAQASGKALPFDVVQSYQDEITGMQTTLSNGLARVQVMHNTTQSITSSTWTALLFNSEDHDTGGMHSTSSNTSRLTVPSGGAAGAFLLHAAAAFAANATGVRGIRFRKNGGALSGEFHVQGFSVSSVGPLIQMSTLVVLAAADYVEVEVFQDSGGALNVAANPRFFAVKIW